MAIQYGQISDKWYIIDPDVTTDHGNSSNVGSIAWALASASNDTLIQLVGGDYEFRSRCYVDTKSGITLRGAGRYTSKIIANRTYLDSVMKDCIFFEDCDNLTVEHLGCDTLNNPTSAQTNNFIIISGGSVENITVRNCLFTGMNPWYALTISTGAGAGANSVKVLDNIFVDGVYGMGFTAYTGGLYIAGVDSVLVARNKFSNCGPGLAFNFINNTRMVFVDNYVHNSEDRSYDSVDNRAEFDNQDDFIVASNMFHNQETYSSELIYFLLVVDCNDGVFAGNIHRNSLNSDAGGQNVDFQNCSGISLEGQISAMNRRGIDCTATDGNTVIHGNAMIEYLTYLGTTHNPGSSTTHFYTY